MNAADIMTRAVVTVAPETEVATVAQLLMDHNISAVPVVDYQGRLVGIISEGDLLGRSSRKINRASWLRLLTKEPESLEELATARHLKAADVMTRHVISVTDDTSIESLAMLMHQRKLKRVPVLLGGKVIGIVSRADVIKGLVGRAAVGDLC